MVILLTKKPPVKVVLERCSKKMYNAYQMNKRNLKFYKDIQNIKYYPDSSRPVLSINLKNGHFIHINLKDMDYYYAETVGGGV